MDDHAPADPRATFAEALRRLRGTVPDVSDELLARRASATALPSGRKVGINARRLGEWLHGRSVPRQFEPVFALVRTIAAATGSAQGPTVEQWRQMWLAAQQHRVTPVAEQDEPGAELVVGRPPTDAVAMRERPELADAIDAALTGGDAHVLLTGPGGMGKSQLAAAAFHRARSRGGVFVWVPASSRQSVVSTYARAWRVIAGEDRPGHQTGGHGYGYDEDTQADLLVAWLRSADRPWLVVLDDVDDPADLEGLWPLGERGRCVITTRRRDARLIREGVAVVEVGVFGPAESVGYLRSRLGSATRDDAELAGLARALGHFPLALGQAAAFVIDTGMEVTAYRELVEGERERLADLFPASSPADGYDRTVATTWQLAARRAEALAKPGTVPRMLELVSLLAPGHVPEAVLLTTAACRWIGGTRLDALMALRALHRLGLVDHEAQVVAMHALVQRAIREAMAAATVPEAVQAAADALDESWTAAENAHDIEAVHTSIEALRRVAGEHLWQGRMHPVLRRAVEHLDHVGRMAAARDTAEDLLRTARSRLGPAHPDVVFLRVSSACATGELGDRTTALAALSAIRSDAEPVLAPTDPDVLLARMHEARQRFELGSATTALDDMTALYDDAKATLGPYHQTTLYIRRHMALYRGMAGDPVSARDEYAALAEELVARFGALHPQTLITRSELARWLGETDAPEAAVEAYLAATADMEVVLGRLHNETLIARHNLAYWRGLAGQLPEAVEEFSVVAEDSATAVGPRNPTTLIARVARAYWLGVGEDPAGGIAELDELEHVLGEVLGATHPRALRLRRQRAELRHRGGDTEGAVAELTAVLAEMRAVQDEDHPYTREAAALLADWGRT
ncbi:ATP-binding protein [Lentzea flava]|nr:ATP-binding protein [Lentzea flava]MCP2201673.1 NB-ARC domain-containing protein [Lentzea flava]